MQKLLSCYVIFILLLIPFFYQSANGKELDGSDDPCDVADTNNPYVSVHLNRMSIPDRETGMYHADFYVYFCANNGLSETGEFPYQIINDVDLQRDPTIPFNGTVLEDHVKGNMITTLDHSLFPFETVPIKIMIESKNLATNELNFSESSEVRFDKKLLIPGIGSEVDRWESFVENHTYVPGERDSDFSRFHVYLFLEPSYFGSFVKYIFPIVIMNLIAVVFYFKLNNLKDRLTILLPLLLGFIFFHVGILNTLPTLNHPTLFDGISFVSYGLFSGIILLTLRRMTKT